MLFDFKQTLRTLFFIFLFQCIYTQNSNNVALLILDDIYYFSANNLCDIQEYKYIYYEDKAKLEIFFPDKRMTFSANSSFVKTDTEILHLVNKVKLIENIFYFPINSFSQLANKFNLPLIEVDKITGIASINDLENNPIVPQDLYSQNISDKTKWSIQTIVLDAGHGGKDPGAIGYHNIKEKNIVLDITNELGKLITKKHPNIDVVYTRTDDTFLGLKNRTSIANKNNGQIFISIHANSSSAKSARGYEIFLLQPKSVDEAIDVAIRENSSIIFEEDISAYNQNQIIADVSQSTFSKESEQLAVFIQNGIKKELPKTRNRGIKQAGFHVLVGASMPNLLIETGFLTNKSEAQKLNKSTYRKKFAKGIYDGIAEYIKYYNKKYIND